MRLEWNHWNAMRVDLLERNEIERENRNDLLEVNRLDLSMDELPFVEERRRRKKSCCFTLIFDDEEYLIISTARCDEDFIFCFLLDMRIYSTDFDVCFFCM